MDRICVSVVAEYVEQIGSPHEDGAHPKSVPADRLCKGVRRNIQEISLLPQKILENI